ncbi:MAG: xanthine dehydrogenase small subunit [Bacteroidales bacterium]|nr:xanthine dehydrogenase small subunit [Bacteroidales bacterium]
MKSSIDFLYNGFPIHIDFEKEGLSPTTTLLNWARNHGHKEVKEGCAEGDCGACTVVIAKVGSDGKLHYKAVNSCILFLPVLDGKLVISSAGLVPETHNLNELHPVQKAIVEDHATQCGFCTPGFVMSIFALYHTKDHYTDDKINNALAGNLCRCTGYDSIRKATKAALKENIPDFYSENEALILKALKDIKTNTLNIRVGEQKYIRPKLIDEAIVLRGENPDAEIINGSTDVALKQSKHFQKLPVLLDLSGVEQLKFIEQKGNEFHIGAGLDLESIRFKAETVFPALYDILTVFASRQIRNVATMGGSLGSASPIGDLLPLIMAMNGSLVLEGKTGQRTIKAIDYVVDYRKTVLQADEIIHSIILPLPTEGEIVKMYKISKRTDMDISTLSTAFRLKLSDCKIDFISMVYGGMAAMTIHATEAEQFLKGKEWNEENISEAAAILEKTFTPLSDARSGDEFRNIAAGNILKKFYEESKLN